MMDLLVGVFIDHALGISLHWRQSDTAMGGRRSRGWPSMKIRRGYMLY